MSVSKPAATVEGAPEPSQTLLGDLIAISRAPAVVSLTDLGRLRGRLSAGQPCGDELTSLLGEYHLGAPETRAAFETIVRSLERGEGRGDAFAVAGVYGSGKSHLLAALTLLAGHPEQAWPAFLTGHDGWPRRRDAEPQTRSPRLVVSVALDEYPTQSHSLEHVVFSRMEEELARRHGVRVALTEDSYLLALVAEHVAPLHGAALEAAAGEAGGCDWASLVRQDQGRASRVALDVLTQTGFPLDWWRSRAEAWAALQAALREHRLDGPVILLDELGLFLAGKDRKGLNADASFLQFVAQLTATERCWLICATQRGLEEAGDIDRRTLRQMRDRFRATFALDLTDLGWVVEHKLVRRLHPDSFPREMDRLHAAYARGGGDIGFSPHELAQSYPLNPLCLHALQRAAEACLSRTRSVARMLQEAASQQGWSDFPASRLITPDAAFARLCSEMSHSPEGRKALAVVETILANATSLAPGHESELEAVIMALGLLALSGLRWSVAQLRASLVGGEHAQLWRDPEALPTLLAMLYRRGAEVERLRREGKDTDEYYLDLATTSGERLRQRLRELLAELGDGDSRLARSALEACTESAFPLAALLDTRSLPVDWQNARRHVSVACRDLCTLTRAELENVAGSLGAPQTREDGALLVALPQGIEAQRQAWIEATAGLSGRFAPALLAWLPRPLTSSEQDHLIEHAALARMVADPTLSRKRDPELQTNLRARWADSTTETRALLQRACYEGEVLAASGGVLEPERLGVLSGNWEATLAAAFGPAFVQLFPRFASIAPERRLAGRAQTNQIIDQFIRPGEAHLPPASALEAHLLAYAKPLRLLEGEERAFRLALGNADLIAVALEATPSRSEREPLDPAEVIAFGELAGRLAKSEWGLAREQSELLIAALLRTGHLVALDAFLQPLRFDVVAAPLSDFLPYVMRATPLQGAAAEAAQTLWSAAMGAGTEAWDLPAQERAWRDLLSWSQRLLSSAEERRAAVERAAAAFGQDPAAWSSILAALATAEAVARGADASLASREGLRKLAQAADRLPGGGAACAQALQTWQASEQFLDQEADVLISLSGLLRDSCLESPQGLRLAPRLFASSPLRLFASPEALISDAAEVRAAAEEWLEKYRRHYLAWHARAQAAARFEPLARLRSSPTLEAARRLARAGLAPEEVAGLEAGLAEALGRRCLAGDPLPAGHVVCPLCGLRLGEEIPLPQVEGLTTSAAELLARQLAALREQKDLLTRRLAGCAGGRLCASVGQLLGEAPPQEVRDALTDDVIAWIRAQRDQPRAARRSLRALGEALQGKELPKHEVRRAVEDWLGRGEGEMVEVVP